MSAKERGIITPEEQEVLLAHRRAKQSKPTKETVRSVKTIIPVSSPTEILNINIGRNNTPRPKASQSEEKPLKSHKKVSRPVKVPAKSLRTPTKPLSAFPNLQYETEKLLRVLSRHSSCSSFKRELQSFGGCKLLENYISLRQNR